MDFVSHVCGHSGSWLCMCTLRQFQKDHFYKWKNHFSEMKGDVGMSPHKKEGEQEDAYTKTRNSFITPSLHLYSCNHTFS